MKLLGHPPEVLFLSGVGLLATGYGLTLLSVKTASLVVGVCCLLLALYLAIRSRREPAPGDRPGFTGDEREPVAAVLASGIADPGPEADTPVPALTDPKPEADIPVHMAAESEPLPEEGAAPPQPAPHSDSPAAPTPPKAPARGPVRLRVQATTYQKGLPPKEHNIHIRLGARGRRRT